MFHTIFDPLSFQVGTDFDLKERVFRNYPRFLGPESPVRLRHVWRFGEDFRIHVAWIDPIGVLASYQEMTVGKESLIDAQNPRIKTPLRPGVWTIKIVYKLKVCAEVQFLVLPYSIYKGRPMTANVTAQLHSGPVNGKYSVDDINTDGISQEILGVNASASAALREQSVLDSARVADHLAEWTDHLTTEFWSVQDACSSVRVDTCGAVDICTETSWSSLSPDPKSELSLRSVSKEMSEQGVLQGSDKHLS